MQPFRFLRNPVVSTSWRFREQSISAWECDEGSIFHGRHCGIYTLSARRLSERSNPPTCFSHPASSSIRILLRQARRKPFRSRTSRRNDSGMIGSSSFSIVRLLLRRIGEQRLKHLILPGGDTSLLNNTYSCCVTNKRAAPELFRAAPVVFLFSWYQR